MKKRASRNGISFGGKIKTQHTILEGLYDKLKEIAAFDEIKSIIPGRIMRRGKSKNEASIEITIPTASGLKALGKSHGATQELFIVTNHPDIVRQKLMEYHK